MSQHTTGPARIPSPASTGAAGTFFEQHVGAYWLAHLLVRAIPPILLDCGVTEVAFQTNNRGWNTDDFLVVGQAGSGGTRKLLGQVKRTFTVSERDEECRQVVQNFWKDFKTRPAFVPSVDRLVLVTLRGSQALLEHFSGLLDAARAARDEAEFEHRLTTPGFLNANAIRYCSVIRAIVDAADGESVPIHDVWAFLRVLHVLSLDLTTDTRQGEAAVKTLLAHSTAEPGAGATADDSWNALLCEAGQGMPRASAYRYEDLPEELRRRHTPLGTRDHRAIKAIGDHSSIILDQIRTALGADVHLRRGRPLQQLLECLEATQVVLVSGAAGSGKSGLAKDAIAVLAADHFVFGFRAEEFACAHFDDTLVRAQIPAGAAAIGAILATQGRKILLVESVERLLEASTRDAFTDLINLVARDPSWRLVLTCRDYSTDLVRSGFLGVPHLRHAVVTVPPLDDCELQEVERAQPAIARPLASPRLRHLLRNPYVHGGAVRELATVLGTHPALRRAYRNWVGELLQRDASAADALFRGVMSDGGITAQFRDDTLVSLLRSTAAVAFLDRHREELFLNNKLLLRRVIHLLCVACVSTVAEPQSNSSGPMANCPDGPAWATVLTIIREELRRFTRRDRGLLLELIDVWTRGVTEHHPYPPGSVAAAVIAYRLLKSYGREDEDQRKRVLKVIARIPRVGRKRFVALLRGRQTARGMRGVSTALQSLVFDEMGGWSAARDMPKTIAAAVADHLICTEEMLTERTAFLYDMDLELLFGIRYGRGQTHFPASAYRGPFLSLLRHHADVGLAAVALTWCLTTPNRFIRDRATKALVSLLHRRLPLLLTLQDQFGSTNDPYLVERLYAVCYGCALRSPNRAGFGELAQQTFDRVFASGRPPAHVLLRDYARGIVEFASYQGIPPRGDVKLVRPPYRSEPPPETAPAWEEIRGRYDDPAYGELIQSLWPNGGDFDRYVLGTNGGDGNLRPWTDRPNPFTALDELDALRIELPVHLAGPWSELTNPFAKFLRGRGRVISGPPEDQDPDSDPVDELDPPGEDDPGDTERIDAFKQSLSDEDRSLLDRHVAAETAWHAASLRLGKMAKDVKATLITALKSEEVLIRARAAAALGELGADGLDALDPLVENLAHENFDVRYAAVFTLGRIGPKATDAVKPLCGAVKDKNLHVKRQAIWALGQIAPKSKDTVAAMIEAVSDEDVNVRSSAVRALGTAGANGGEAVGPLLELLKAERPAVSTSTVAESLKKIGAENAKAETKVLTDALALKDASVRVFAANALAAKGADAKAADPALLPLLKDSDLQVREAARSALEKVDPEAAKQLGKP